MITRLVAGALIATGLTVVPLAPTTAGWTLRWTTSGGGTYDVRVRKGSGPWRAFREDTTAATARFHRPGTWSVRARTQVGSTRSDWSPPVKVRTAR